MIELKHLKFNDFKQVCESYEQDDSDSRDLYQTMLDKYCADFIEYFRPSILSGRFTVPDFMHHQTNPGFELSEILKGKSPKYGAYYGIERELAHSAFFNHTYYFNRKHDRSVVLTYEQVYEALIKFTHTLSIAHVSSDMLELRFIFGDSIEAQCFECGDRLRLMVQNRENPSHEYQFSLVCFDETARFVPAKTCKCHELKHWTDKITFPTGRVYAADWFRVLNFTKIIGKEDDKYRISLNSRLGCFKISRLYAKMFNFAKFQVGNSSPTIFANSTQIVFGSCKEDPPPKSSDESLLNEKGYICTDLWAACFIDHEVLVNLLAENNPSLSKAEVESAVLSWAKHSGEHIVEFNVEPGEYVMQYDGTSEDFHKNFERNAEFPNIEVMGILEKVKTNE